MTDLQADPMTRETSKDKTMREGGTSVDRESSRTASPDGKPSEGADEAFFLEHHAGEPTLPVRAHPCADCAVVEGMYLGISNDLARCSHEVIAFAVPRWFCHSTPSYACRGNADNVLGGSK